MIRQQNEPISAEYSILEESGEWHEVNESWLDSDLSSLEPAGRSASTEMPSGSRRISEPPPLPPAHLVSSMLERLVAEDYEGALMAARASLAIHPTNDDARQIRDIAASSLRKVYYARLGSRPGDLARVHRNGSARGATPQQRAVLYRVKGRQTVDEIMEDSPLDRLECLRVLSELALMNFVSVEHDA